MFRPLAVGILCMVHGLWAVSLPAAEEAEKEATSRGCGCSQSQADRNGRLGMCLCLYYKYAEYLSSTGELVRCYYGMYCDDYSAGTVSWEDDHEMPISQNTCSPGCNPIPPNCFQARATRAAVRDAVAEMKTQHKPHKGKAELLHKGAKDKIEPQDKLLTFCDETQAWESGNPVWGMLKLPGAGVIYVKMDLVKIQLGEAEGNYPKTAYFGFGRQLSRRPDGVGITQIHNAQVEYVMPSPQAEETRALFVTHYGTIYRVLLGQTIPIPK